MRAKVDIVPKDKRRSNEKRKERSRDAARSRRSRETEIFTDLANALPIPTDQIPHLDKASTIRLTTSYLRTRKMIDLVPNDNCASMPVVESKEDESNLMNGLKSELDDSTSILRLVDGFLLVVSSDGDITYVSENVTDYLGVTHIDLMGQSIYDYSHPCDHDDMKEALSSKSASNGTSRSMLIRLKCTLTSRGRSVNLKSATYKVINCTGHILQDTNDDTKNESRLAERCFVALGKPIPHPSNIETHLPQQIFLTKHSLDMKFTNAKDSILTDILGYNADELIGKSAYDYYHAADTTAMFSALKNLFCKGQCETGVYRFLARRGGYVLVQTQASLIYDPKIQKPQSIVCINYVCSGVEHKDEIYSVLQSQASDKCMTEVAPTVDEYCNTNLDSVITLIDHTCINTQSRSEPEEDYASHASIANRISSTVVKKNIQNVNDKLDVKIGGVKSTRNNCVLDTRATLCNVITAYHDDGDYVENNECEYDDINNDDDNLDSIVSSEVSRKLNATLQITANNSLNSSPCNSSDESSSNISLVDEVIPNHCQADSTKCSTVPLCSILEPTAFSDIKVEPPIITTTSKLFAPRTEEMNKGFLTFSERKPGETSLKDSPDDLSHLAPTAGDACVPLDDHPLFPDMMDNIVLEDNLNQLLNVVNEDQDEQFSTTLEDPFIAYRDAYNLSPELFSSIMFKNSDSSLASMNSPSDSISDEEHMSTFMNLQLNEHNESNKNDFNSTINNDILISSSLPTPEPSVKTPFVPMITCEDFTLFANNDLMWTSETNGNNSVNNISLHHDINSCGSMNTDSNCSSPSRFSNYGGDDDGGELNFTIPTHSNIVQQLLSNQNCLENGNANQSLSVYDATNDIFANSSVAQSKSTTSRNILTGGKVTIHNKRSFNELDIDCNVASPAAKKQKNIPNKKSGRNGKVSNENHSRFATSELLQQLMGKQQHHSINQPKYQLNVKGKRRSSHNASSSSSMSDYKAMKTIKTTKRMASSQPATVHQHSDSVLINLLGTASNRPPPSFNTSLATDQMLIQSQNFHPAPSVGNQCGNTDFGTDGSNFETMRLPLSPYLADLSPIDMFDDQFQLDNTSCVNHLLLPDSDLYDMEYTTCTEDAF